MVDSRGIALLGRPVVWTSSSIGTVIVSANGIVTAIGPGNATISALSEGKSGTALVIVVAPPTAVIAPTVVAAGGASLCFTIAGASVVAYDGTYLGRLAGKFDQQSIYNQFGQYGSKFQSLSIYNPFGTYGSQFSSLSAFNKLASTPPVLVKNGTPIAYFTINTLKTPYVHPGYAESCNFQ